MKEEPQVIIGLEIHCQLTTLKSKLFCSCPASYRALEPNSNICPVCTGIPGTLPVLNGGAVECAARIAIALNSTLADRIIFFRKNYFYPDLPKNFQISQYDKAGGIPLSHGGSLILDDGSHVRIRRIQLEEDPGRISYEGTITSSSYSLIDYNRAGVALVEIVTEPDLTSPKQARAFLEKLRAIIEDLGVSDLSLEGSLRCDANISIHGGRRVEVKNISSFKEVERALRFEITRQTMLTKSKRADSMMETRHWDETRRITVSLRGKEEEEEYRYFPEPDLPPVLLSREFIDAQRSLVPEPVEQRRQRFTKDYGLSPHLAKVLTGNRSIADFYEECLRIYMNPRKLAGWIAGDIMAFLNQSGKEFRDLKIKPDDLATLARMNDKNELSDGDCKKVLLSTLQSEKAMAEVIRQTDTGRISDESSIQRVLTSVFDRNPSAVQDALVNENAVNFLVGEALKASGGKLDPKEARKRILLMLEVTAKGPLKSPLKQG